MATPFQLNLVRIRGGVTLRLAAYRQSVHLGAKPLETHDHIFFQLNPYGHSPYVTPSLKRGWVYILLVLLVFASAVILGYEFRVTRPYFTSTVSESRVPQPGGPGPRIYIPQESGYPVITPVTGFPFRHLIPLAGLRCRCSNPLPRGLLNCLHFVPLVTARHGHRRKHIFQQFYRCMLIRCCGDMFVRDRYPATALVYLLISLSLPSNGSTHYNIAIV
jgi:hypothetical protein